MRFFNWFLNFFFPPRCASCKAEGDFLCAACLSKIKVCPIRTCSTHPSKLDFKHLDAVIYAVDYNKNPLLKPAVFQFKYKFNKSLCEQFSDLMVKKIEELKMIECKELILIPVPLHKKRLAYRGFNQANLLAMGIADRLGSSAEVCNVLKRVKNTSQQAKLAKKQREENLNGAFVVAQSPVSVSNKLHFLVDDVCTTGSTLEECARVLKEAGIKKVYGLVMARAFKN